MTDSSLSSDALLTHQASASALRSASQRRRGRRVGGNFIIHQGVLRDLQTYTGVRPPSKPITIGSPSAAIREDDCVGIGQARKEQTWQKHWWCSEPETSVARSSRSEERRVGKSVDLGGRMII